MRLANLLGALATGLTDAIHDAAVAAEAPIGATGATALLALLDAARASSVQRLSKMVGLTHPGTVRLVDRLASAGYVERRPGADARSISVSLTPRGRRVARRLRERRQAAIAAACAGLDREQRGELARSCEVMLTNLTHQRLAQRAGGAPPSGGALCRMCDFEACGRARGRCPAASAAATWEWPTPPPGLIGP